MNLVQAIDAVLAFVNECNSREENYSVMTRAEMDEFQKLADTVYQLAFERGLVDAIPQIPELAPELESKGLPPVQYESKLNLPGDWESDWESQLSEFVIAVDEGSRWLSDMKMLQQLVGKKRKRTGRPKKGESSPDLLIIGALAEHHKYRSVAIVVNLEPVGVRELAEKLKGEVSTKTVSKFFTKQFGDHNGKDGHKRYVAACKESWIGKRLALLQGDMTPERFRLLLEHDGSQKDQQDDE